MASTTQDRVYEEFLAIAARDAVPGGTGSEQLAQAASDVAHAAESITAVLDRVTPVMGNAGAVRSTGTAEQADSTVSSVLMGIAGTLPIGGAVNSVTGGGGGIGSTLESIASTVFKSGLGLVPLIGGLFGLFGGGDSEPAPALVKYAMPAALEFRGAVGPAGMSNSDYDQNGMARVFAEGGDAGGAAASGAAPQITVNVSAMDARSFMDRSGDIAAAVREAMLNLNSINDVVNDL